MSDLAMVKACAEAMGLLTGTSDDPAGFYERIGFYNPLVNDAQAMALVKKFQINIQWFEVNVPGRFEPNVNMWGETDLNRAIVECVAKMHNGRKV